MPFARVGRVDFAIEDRGELIGGLAVPAELGEAFVPQQVGQFARPLPAGHARTFRARRSDPRAASSCDAPAK